MFRDQTDLSLAPHLWGEIEKSLQDSEFFILLASPESANSHWVQQEVHYWLNNKPKENFIIALTGGIIAWDEQANDFDWKKTTSIAPKFEKIFQGEPLYADLSTLKQSKDLNLKSAVFVDSIKSIAAKLHNKTVGELFSEVEHQHRKTIWIRNGAITILSLLLLVSIGFLIYSIIQRDQARSRLAMRYWDEARKERDKNDFVRTLHFGSAAAEIIDEELLPSLLFDMDVAQSINFLHENQVGGADFSPDGKKFLSWSSDAIRLWDIETYKQVGEVMRHKEMVKGAIFSADGKMILSWDNNTIRLWDVEKKKQLGNPMHHVVRLLGAVFSADDKIILSWDPKTIQLWDVETKKQLGEVIHDEISVRDDESGVRGVVLNADGKKILSWSDYTIRLWDVKTRKQIGKTMYHYNTVVDMFKVVVPFGAGFSANEKKILSWGFKAIRSWDVETGKQLGEVMHHEGWINGAVFSRDGKKILSWSSDNTIRIWDVETRKQFGEPMYHSNIVRGAVFSADEKKILSWSDDKTVRLWDVETRKQIGEVMRHRGAVICAEFSADEKRILSCNGDSTVQLWNSDVDMDIPIPLFSLQVKVLTRAEMNLETKELSVIDPVRLNQLIDEYEKEATEHYKVCQYPEANVWRRFHLEKAEMIRPLLKK